MTLYLHTVHQFLFDDYPSDAILKKYLSTEHNFVSRRASRISLIALTGALGISAKAIEKMPKDTGVYLSSSFSSPTNTFGLMLDTLHEKTLRPFNFINSINNAASFYVANALNLQGANLFISSLANPLSWSKPILLAMTDLQAGITDTALVGWCHEHKPLVESMPQEGSHWILLSTEPKGAIATITLAESSTSQDPVQKTFMENTLNANRYYYHEIYSMIQALGQDSTRSYDIPTGLYSKKILIQML